MSQPQTSLQPNPPKNQLVRGLTLTHAAALVVGSVIGTGVFIKSGKMSQTMGGPIWVLLAWVASGVLSLLGALTYAELGSMLPATGGEYAYLKTAYGRAPAFLFGWMRFVLGTAGSIAAYAVGMTTMFLVKLVDLGKPWVVVPYTFLGQAQDWTFGLAQIVAVIAIWVFSILNCIGIKFGGKVQTAITSIKVLGILSITIGALFFSKTGSIVNVTTPSASSSWMGLSPFLLAMLAALWAYDGWNLMPMAAGEVKNPGRNVPRALVFGMLGVLVIYTLINFSYFYALPYAAVKNAQPSIAVRVVQAFTGPLGVKILTLLMILSSLGALNGSILTSARVPFAMAQDGLFFQKVGTLSEKTRVPVWSILIQAVWSSVIAISGKFDQITDAVLFAGFIFYALTAAGVFILRKKQPTLPRPYRTIGYPVIPALFIVFSLAITVNTFYNQRLESLFGLVLILLGIPFYLYFRRKQRLQEPSSATSV